MKLLLGLVMFFLSGISMAQVHIKGYTKKDGTYVAPHERTAPDSTKNNNYSTKGNINPYTGKAGTVDPDGTPSNASPAPAPTYTPPPQPAYAAPAPIYAQPKPVVPNAGKCNPSYPANCTK
jgi:hypothetical protein